MGFLKPNARYSKGNDGGIIMLTMKDMDLANKRVMIREDLNVPIENGKITNDARIQRALPTLKAALAKNAAVIVLSHLGRPTEGQFDPALSLAPVAEALSKALKKPVKFVAHWLDGVTVSPGEIVLCENVRFNVGEENNNPALAQRMATLCDIFVMDAFATAHRAQASTVGVAEFAAQVCAGPLLMEELQALSAALQNPKRPVIAIVGGSKVSTKINLLNSLIEQVDVLIVGGGIANTLLASQQYSVGKSLYEANWLSSAQALLTKTAQLSVQCPLPEDVVVATEFSRQAKATIKSISDINDNDMILDIGPKTAEQYAKLLAKAGTIIWNGPVGVFEWPQFSKGTEAIATAIAQSAAFSIVGGGDTLAALDQFNVANAISYVSTGGGAFLEFIEHKTLPAISVLEKRAQTV